MVYEDRRWSGEKIYVEIGWINEMKKVQDFKPFDPYHRCGKPCLDFCRRSEYDCAYDEIYCGRLQG